MKWTSLPSLMLFLFLNICDAAEATVAVRNGSGEEVLLQGFHWNSSRTPEKWYEVLDRMASTIGKDGFTLIWMPPPWVDESKWQTATASGGGEGYFWYDFSKSSRYGTAEQLMRTAAALNSAGVKVVYDVVPNHMSENREVTMFPRGRTEWRHDCARCDEGDPFMDGTADLNTGNAEVFETFKKEFTNLRDQFGAQGLRFDFVRPLDERLWRPAVLCRGNVERPKRIPARGLAAQCQLAGCTERLVRSFALHGVRLRTQGAHAERHAGAVARWP